ncbi:unnamed protein product [Strongylus vulgaris]|uniref:EGF-like domain-containing protein n=1 Tax=Strongylus vulgaris TaxID=40348 RepID=A0A3P7JJS6_STRVU|nr:unnamed protein product [Strongylus vulgaris]
MIVFLLLFLTLTLSYQQTETLLENPLNPPHGCANFGLCIAPEPFEDEITGETYYTCPTDGCVCNPGTEGDTCETIIPKCAPDPCPKTTGSMFICKEGLQNYTCVCQPGFTGEDCTIDLASVCATNPCLNGATCKSTNNVDYTCSKCPEGKMGHRCQYNDPCADVDCQNGGVCVPIFDGAHFYCQCKENWQQVYCGRTKYIWLSFHDILAADSTGLPKALNFPLSAETVVTEGCFETNAALADTSYYKNITEPGMSITKCKKHLMSILNIFYTMFSKFLFKIFRNGLDYNTAHTFRKIRDFTEKSVASVVSS